MKGSGEASGVVIFLSRGTTPSKGVCILVNPSLRLSSSIENFSKDWDGRIVSVDLIFKTAGTILLCNVYASSDSQQQQMFLYNLNECLMSNTDTSNLIIGGDWNVTLQSLYKRGGVPWKASTYRNKLILMMEELELIDIFGNIELSYESKLKHRKFAQG